MQATIDKKGHVPPPISKKNLGYILALLFILIVICGQALAKSPDAETSIAFRAYADFVDGSGNPHRTNSNEVKVVVQAVRSIGLNGGTSQPVQAGKDVWFYNSITNNGNAPDSVQIKLTYLDSPGTAGEVRLYSDVNADGKPDSETDYVILSRDGVITNEPYEVKDIGRDISRNFIIRATAARAFDGEITMRIEAVSKYDSEARSSLENKMEIKSGIAFNVTPGKPIEVDKDLAFQAQYTVNNASDIDGPSYLKLTLPLGTLVFDNTQKVSINGQLLGDGEIYNGKPIRISYHLLSLTPNVTLSFETKAGSQNVVGFSAKAPALFVNPGQSIPLPVAYAVAKVDGSGNPVLEPNGKLFESDAFSIKIKEDQVLDAGAGSNGFITPKGKIIYIHQLKNLSGSPIASNIVEVIATNSLSGFRTKIYADPQQTGSIDGKDPLFDSKNGVGGHLPFEIPANGVLQMLVEVIDEGATGMQPLTNSSTVTFSGKGAPATVVDTTTISDARLTIEKAQLLDETCQGPARRDAQWSDSEIQAKPGQCVWYQVKVTNTGAMGVDTVSITDRISPHTDLVMESIDSSTGQAEIVGSDLHLPIGPMEMGSSHKLTYQVKIKK